MRMSEWTPEVIQFMQDASETSSYFKVLASRVADQFAVNSEISDMGCGMGQLSFELSPLVKKVTAIDYSQLAIRYLKDTVNKYDMSNIFPHWGDMEYSDLPCGVDAMVFCLSTSLEKALMIAGKHQANAVIVVNKIHHQNFSMQKRESCTPLAPEGITTAKLLQRQGISCEIEEITLDFGQPFRCLEDAVRYFSLFRTIDYPHGISKKELISHLDERAHPKYPFFLPMTRHLLIFSVDLKTIHAHAFGITHNGGELFMSSAIG